jgi:hypothetical protein
LGFDHVEEFEWFEAGPVELVEERDHRESLRATDFEELECLRLDALRGVEHHDNGIDC